MRIVAVVLTFNEELHLDRCLRSLQGVVTSVLVVDSFSTDATVHIARAHDAMVLEHAWVNYATQFNWALEQLPRDTDWVLRIDADEVLTPQLSEEIRKNLPMLAEEVDGVYCGRRMTFLGQRIRHGGVFPIRVLRLFRSGRGRCEQRWMDEHIKISGISASFNGEIIDDNLNTLSWWIDKHNRYASREAVDLLNLEFEFLPRDTVSSLHGASEPGVKRWLKEEIYARLPGGARALLYFTYRYLFRLGFLDGPAGAFHILQGLWYRYLVDAKIAEVKRYMRNRRVGVQDAVQHILGISV
jgi:glycosyltransferase involved in cell wall biosynthesis